MARSKDVYAVLGLLCVDPVFRKQFFEHPVPAAKKLVGSLTKDEQLQVQRLAGLGDFCGDRGQYIKQLTSELGDVCQLLDCPHFPCPEPDPFDE